MMLSIVPDKPFLINIFSNVLSLVYITWNSHPHLVYKGIWEISDPAPALS